MNSSKNDAPDVIMAIGAFVDGIYNVSIDGFKDAGRYAQRVVGSENKLPTEFYENESVSSSEEAEARSCTEAESTTETSQSVGHAVRSWDTSESREAPTASSWNSEVSPSLDHNLSSLYSNSSQSFSEYRSLESTESHSDRGLESWYSGECETLSSDPITSQAFCVDQDTPDAKPMKEQKDNQGMPEKSRNPSEDDPCSTALDHKEEGGTDDKTDAEEQKDTRTTLARDESKHKDDEDNQLKNPEKDKVLGDKESSKNPKNEGEKKKVGRNRNGRTRSRSPGRLAGLGRRRCRSLSLFRRKRSDTEEFKEEVDRAEAATFQETRPDPPDATGVATDSADLPYHTSKESEDTEEHESADDLIAPKSTEVDESLDSTQLSLDDSLSAEEEGEQSITGDHDALVSEDDINLNHWERLKLAMSFSDASLGTEANQRWLNHDNQAPTNMKPSGSLDEDADPSKHNRVWDQLDYLKNVLSFSDASALGTSPSTDTDALNEQGSSEVEDDNDDDDDDEEVPDSHRQASADAAGLVLNFLPTTSDLEYVKTSALSLVAGKVDFTSHNTPFFERAEGHDKGFVAPKTEDPEVATTEQRLETDIRNSEEANEEAIEETDHTAQEDTTSNERPLRDVMLGNLKAKRIVKERGGKKRGFWRRILRRKGKKKQTE